MACVRVALASAALLAACSRPAPPLTIVDERAFDLPVAGLKLGRPMDFDGEAIVATYIDAKFEQHVYRFDTRGATRVAGPIYGSLSPQVVAVSGATTATALPRPDRVAVGDRVIDGPAEALWLAGDRLFIGGGGAVRVVAVDDGRTVATLGTPRRADDLGFGAALAYADNVLVVGEPPRAQPSAPTSRGRAHVFRRDGDRFQLLGSVEGGDDFARAVATDGRWVAVGDPYADEGPYLGEVVLWRIISGDRLERDATLRSSEPGNWSQLGAGLSFGGGRLAVAAPGSIMDPKKRPGAVYLYERCGDRWSESLVVRGAYEWRVVLRGDLLATSLGERRVVSRLRGGCAAGPGG